MKLFVGNLNSQAADSDLIKLFTEFGVVKSVKLVVDAYTRRPKGFAFVEMENRAAGENAIGKLDNTLFLQQTIVVNEAKPKSGGIKQL
jgi:RNA recognition motif-containing protein